MPEEVSHEEQIQPQNKNETIHNLYTTKLMFLMIYFNQLFHFLWSFDDYFVTSYLNLSLNDCLKILLFNDL